MRTKLIAACIATAGLSACAQSPGSIAPVSMGNAFSYMDCYTARTELVDERARLEALEKQQRSAVAGDAIGVFLLAVPVSSLTGGDVAGEIGASKGKVLALENRMYSCS